MKMILNKCSGNRSVNTTLPGAMIRKACQGQNPKIMTNKIPTSSKMFTELGKKAAESCLCVKEKLYLTAFLLISF